MKSHDNFHFFTETLHQDHCHRETNKGTASFVQSFTYPSNRIKSLVADNISEENDKSEVERYLAKGKWNLQKWRWSERNLRKYFRMIGLDGTIDHWVNSSRGPLNPSVSDSFQRALNLRPGKQTCCRFPPRTGADTVSVANDDADRWILRQWHHQNEERLGGVHLTLLMISWAP